MDIPTLKRVERLDSIPLQSTYWTAEGYLVDKPIVTSVGIFEYLQPDGSIRRELRLPEHVFDKESLASYRGKPVILTHRAGTVNKNNVDREHIGTILSDGIQDGDDVRAEIVIHDTDLIQKSGLRELSLGYSLDLDETPGVWNGQPYDAVQTNIRINHLALVEKARAGEQARLNIDSHDEISEGGTTMSEKLPLTPEELAEAIELYRAKLVSRTDGEDTPPAKDADPEPAENEDGSAACGKKDAEDIDCQNTDGGDPLKAIEARRDKRKDSDIPSDKASIKQMDEDIGTLLQMIEQLKAKADFDSAPSVVKKGEESEKAGAKPMNADSVDAIVRERVGMLRICDKLRLDGTDSMTIPQLKKAIIGAMKPTLRLDGKSGSYIDALYEIALDEINARKDTDYQRRQMFNADGVSRRRQQPSGAFSRRQKMIDDMDGGNNE